MAKRRGTRPKQGSSGPRRERQRGAANGQEVPKSKPPSSNPPLMPMIARVPNGSRMVFPNDHARAIVELLRPASPDLARRWLAALLLVPAGERLGLVEAVERSIVAEYGGALRAGDGPASSPTGERTADTATPLDDKVDNKVGEPRTLRVARPPVQRDGYVEQVFTEYEVQRSDG